MSDYIALSFHLTQTPIELFERLALTQAEGTRFGQSLRDFLGFDADIVTLATCNRFEIYLGFDMNVQSLDPARPQTVVPTHPKQAASALISFLAARIGVNPEQLSQVGSIRSGDAVIAHLFRTVCGLDSIALGEKQIQGQVKTAYRQAREAGHCSRHLSPLFEAALHAGKHARSATGLEEARISLGSMAIDFLCRQEGISEPLNVTILGTGKMAKNAAKHLQRHKLSARITFLSRHPQEREKELASTHASVSHLSQLTDVLQGADLLLAAYGTKNVFLTVQDLQPILAAQQKMLYIIDIALPRDVDPGVAALSNVRLIDFTTLQEIKESDEAFRASEIQAAEKIIEEELQQFLAKQKLKQATGAISFFRQKAESIRQQELEKALRRLPQLHESEQKVLQKLTYNIVSRILRNPTLRLREKAQTGGIDETYLRIVQEIFVDMDKERSLKAQEQLT